MTNKPTDAEIIKALEYHSHKSGKDLNCCDCAYFPMEYCSQTMSGHAVDLINHLKAENERLQCQVNRLKKYDEERDIRLHARLTETARAEAIKEVIHRLQKSIVPQLGISTLEQKEAYYFCLDEMDKIEGEMVGESE